MNKKAIFYSVSVLLFLLILLIIFTGKARSTQRDEALHIERSKLVVMDHFSRDFERYYIPMILSTAARPALVNLSDNPLIDPTDLVALMKTGDVPPHSMNPLLSTDVNLDQSLATLSFILEERLFWYEVSKIEQVNYTHMRIFFSVDYTLSAFDTTWSSEDLEYNVTFPVFGLVHPIFTEIYGVVIGQDWIENSTLPCLSQQLFESVSGCTGKNIMPAPVCPNGIIESGEECDDSNSLPGDGCNADCMIEIVIP